MSGERVSAKLTDTVRAAVRGRVRGEGWTGDRWTAADVVPRLGAVLNPDISVVRDYVYEPGAYAVPRRRTPTILWRGPKWRFAFWSFVLYLSRPLRFLRLRGAADRLGDAAWDGHWKTVDIEPRATYGSLFWGAMARLSGRWRARYEKSAYESGRTAWYQESAWGDNQA